MPMPMMPNLPEPDWGARKRTLSFPLISSVRSAKRRRISLASTDLLGEIEYREPLELTSETFADRFIPSRPKNILPLNITPRTNRIARVFGLSDDRILHFGEDAPITSPPPDARMFAMLRQNASQLFRPQQFPKPYTSAASHLGARKQCLLALDGPGTLPDPFSHPLSWSPTNCIAVACGSDVYYQNLNTREISHLCQLVSMEEGLLQCIEWGGTKMPSTLALGTTSGMVQLWDTIKCQPQQMGVKLRTWMDSPSFARATAMSWQGDILAVGRGDGSISLFDVRMYDEVKRVNGHRGRVCGVSWSQNGMFMASGDLCGGVYIWDSRASKSLTDGAVRGPKVRHKGPVKALAWCPWKMDLLATGSGFPEGSIRVWSSNNFAFSGDSRLFVPTPVHTISLNTSVTSLQWSPHSKELLSTHGPSWLSPPPPRLTSPVKTTLTNSITVHSYPGLKRLVSVTAHSGPIVKSCLSPDGTMVFTICPREEAMKMWKVWGKREEPEKKDSIFDKCTIR